MSKPTIPDVVPRFAAYYATHPTWGSLHIVLDDQNVKDDHVDFCIQSAQEQGDVEGHALAIILRQMSKTQRAKLGYAARRYTEWPR